MSQSTTEVKQYNNAHLSGWCYVNDVRLVNPSKGASYYSLSISVLQGTKATPEYLRIRSANAVGEQAIACAIALHDLSQAKRTDNKNDRKRIFAQFKLSDLQINIYQSGGEHKPSLMGRLFALTHIQVDGDQFNVENERIIQTTGSRLSEPAADPVIGEISTVLPGGQALTMTYANQ